MPDAHYQRMIRGDYTQFEAARENAGGEWAAVYDALYAAATRQQPPRISGPVHQEAWLCARQVGLFAATAFDLGELARVAQLEGEGPGAATVRHFARMWHCVWAGHNVEGDAPDLSALGAEDPGVAIEYTSLCALAALHGGRADEALSLARRASRMAASEGVLQMEYLANLVLARVRRHSGHAHLALRILNALQRVVPPMWQRWVALELFLAGSREVEIPGLPLCPAVDAELRTLDAMMGADARDQASEGWCAGAVSEPPYGIAGPAVDPNYVAAIVVAPGRSSRRVLYAGLRPELALVAEAPKARRLRLAICHLVSAEVVPADALFHQVYGFPREDTGHDELLRGIVHRARKALSGVAEIVREGENLSVRCDQPFAVPDPRCERSLGERVLTYLSALNGRATAKQIAQGLGVPLRSVQRTLGDLVDEGACETQPDGRRTEYVLEDTTFAEPTLHRLRGNH